MTTNDSRQPEESVRLTEVERLLEAGQPQQALTAAEQMTASPWADNARAVCLMRLGRATQATSLLRRLVFDPAGVAVRVDADPLFLVNYATTLLLEGNIDGCRGILADVHDRRHPAVVRLADALRRWAVSQTWLERVRSLLGVPSRLPTLDVPPGSL